MKRLIKKADGNITLYHLTDIDGAMGIVKDKLIIPNKQRGAGKPGNHFELDLERALQNGDVEKAEKIKKHIEKMDDNFYGYVFLTNDYQDKLMQYGEGIVFEVSVPTDNLEVDNNDCYDCETWQESLAKKQQCKVKGSISESEIQKIYVYNANNQKVVDTTLDEFEEQYKEYVNRYKNKDYFTLEEKNTLDNRWIQTLSDEEQLDLIKKSQGRVIKYIEIENVSEEVLVDLLKEDFRFIKNIPNQTTEIQMLAIQQNKEALKYIQYPTIEVQKYAIENNLVNDLNQVDESLLQESIKNMDPELIITMFSRQEISEELLLQVMKSKINIFYQMLERKINIPENIYLEILQNIDANEFLQWAQEEKRINPKMQMPSKETMRILVEQGIITRQSKQHKKRLLKKAPNPKQTLYHTTSLQNWLKIKEDGFFISQGSKSAGINYNKPTEKDL